MAPEPQPRPVELPLPGGRKDATVRLQPLLCGEATWPEAWPHREDGRLGRLHAIGVGVKREKWISLPIVAFLVEHPGAGPILIDTGLDPVVADEPRKSFGRLLAATSAKTFSMASSQTVPTQLRARGVDPDQVKHVLMTHLHYDHASGISQFPEATFLVTKREWDAAHAAFRLFHGYVTKHFDHPFAYRFLDFESDRAASYSTFGRSLDLFGDGSVRAVFTPGHTHGHVSIVLRTATREVLIAADAAYTRHTVATGHRPAHMEDEHLFTRSLREIQLYSEQNPDSLLIPGHDMEAWQKLDAVYD
jgi:glyoxylase-like metal-dependent hydrolase (beta-lactamase superfamily II)